MALPNSVQLAQKEGRIALVVQAFKQGHISSVYTTAKMYNIPKLTL
jgi:predicted HTH domain antitoxin